MPLKTPPQTMPQEFWAHCLAVRGDFAVLYAGYTHFRSKGWIPRTGLQYGAEFVLYQKHPALAHSEYAVLVLPLFQERAPNLSWHDVQIAGRLSAQVCVCWDDYIVNIEVVCECIVAIGGVYA